MLLDEEPVGAPGRGARPRARRDRPPLRDRARGPRAGRRRVRAGALRGAGERRVRRRGRAPLRDEARDVGGAARHDRRGAQVRHARAGRITLALMARAARWYEQKLGRADMALGAYQQVLAGDPANEAAAEGMTGIYRRAQQWPELVSVLMARADVAASAPKARDLRAEAAEILETRLNDMARARDLFMTVLADDPGHARACDAMARIAERTGDFVTLAQILERRAEARRGAGEGRGAREGRRGLRGPPQRSRRGDAPLRGRPRDRPGEPQRPQGPRPHLQPHRASTASSSRSSSVRSRSPRRRARRSTSTSASRASTTRSSSITQAPPRRSRRSSRSTPRTTARSARSRVTTARSRSGSRSCALYEKHASRHGRRDAPDRPPARAGAHARRADRLARPRDEDLRADPRDPAVARRRARGARAAPRDERRRARGAHARSRPSR